MKYFKTIEDCPIWNLNKINETGDVRYLIKGIDYFDDLPDKQLNMAALLDQYGKISEDLFVNFGFDDSFIAKMKTEKEMLIMSFQILAGQKHLKAIKKVRERNKKEFETKVKGKNQDFEEKIVLLETYFKKDFNVQQMPVKKFYTYLKVYKKANTKK